VPWWRLAKEWKGTGTGTTSSAGRNCHLLL
jgi:hypothetical protein